ncbi:MAG TPA: hypothetical protein VFG07_08320 [Thermoplasmata archaeon]|nr:hypothetical protein [Thermoplasmata archaeon]
MIACPACGLETPDGATECARCHLSTSLFDSVREAAGDQADRDPKYVQTIGEILSQLGDEPASPGPETTSATGRLAFPHRFPSPAAAAEKAPVAEPTGPSPRPLGTLPALPPAGEVPLLLRQVNDFLQLGRRQGVDLAPFTERAREALAVQDRGILEALARDLFVFLAAALTEEYEGAVARRNEIAGLVPTASPDVELEGCRASLALGDLAGAQRRLRHVEDALSDLEEEWATVQILVTEADLLTVTIRELGGDPGPALGPLAEGQRRARAGDRAGAEPVLARAALALWTILNPIFQRDLGRLKEQLMKRRAEGADVRPPTAYLRQLAADLRNRNFASAILTYRSLRDSVANAEAAPGDQRGAAAAPAAPPPG